MKKWALLKSQHEYGENEVWEYFNTKEELELLPYYVKKHTRDIEKTPVVMNGSGGWYHVNQDRIISVREGNRNPFALREMYPNPNEIFSNGWISTEGECFVCSPYGHLDCADMLVQECSCPVSKEDIGNPDERLLKNGWIKVTRGEAFTYDFWEGATEEQLRIIERYELKCDMQ